MSMAESMAIRSIDASNVEELGFFCYKSKPKSTGYRQKLAWLKERFEAGLRMKLLYEGQRSVGFVEYMPGERAWRAVEAAGYLVVHCLWVVGRAKGKGYGSRLIEECVADAKNMQKNGVAMVASTKTWLADKRAFVRNGFEVVDHAPPSFDLVVRRLGNSTLPSFPKNWAERARRFGDGLTIIRSNQCPYHEDATGIAATVAATRGVDTEVVTFQSAEELQQRAPSAYGVFSLVYNGRLLSYTYQTEKDMNKLLNESSPEK